MGISKEAVRKRISRDTLRSDKDPDGTVRVYVPASEPPSGAAARDEFVDALRGEISHLRRESERKDAIIMSLSQANAEQARAIREIEAPSDAPGTPEGSEAPPGTTGPQTGAEGAQRRPWWRRWLGGP